MQQSPMLSQIPNDSDSSFQVIKGGSLARKEGLGVVYLKQQRPRSSLLNDVSILRRNFLLVSHIMEGKVIATDPPRNL
jgi:hypothetical protein